MNPRLVRSTRSGHRTAGKAALAVAFMSGTVGAGALAAADEPTTQELMDQIQQLQKQVEAMQAKKAAEAAAAPAVAEKDAVARVLDDAERRSSKPALLVQDDPDPFTAGHNGKFLLQSADGNFSLNPNFQLQIRHVVNINNEGGDSFEDTDFGWEIRRFKVGFKGNAFSPDLTYDFKFAFDRDGGGAELEQAFVDYTPDRLFENAPQNMGFRIGQFKDLTFREESVSSSSQLAADRSLVNEAIGGGNTDYIQGFGPIFKGDNFKAILLYTDGAATANTDYQDDGADFGIAGRVDFTVMGDDKAMDDFTALGTEENSARLGAGFHYTGDGDSRVVHHSFDGQYETAGGLGLFGGYYGRWFEADGGDDGFDVGAMAQVSQLLGDDGWEIFGRYDFVMFDGDITAPDGVDTDDFFHELTAGVNKYWEGHKVKMTIDVVYLPNGNPGSFTGIGLRANGGEFDDQVSIRGQFQFLL